MSCKLEMRGVSFRRGNNTILDGAGLSVEPGGVAIFGGRSGSGKSALLEICAGLLKPACGEVLWDGDDIVPMSKYELYGRRKSVGYVFQTHALIANHSVLDNIALPLKCGTDLGNKEITERVRSLMHELGISPDIEKRFPETLSAAQLKCAAVARALINKPRLLLLDEPFSGVDPHTADRIVNAVHGRWKKGGMTVIMSSHSLGVWPEWDAQRSVLKDGRLEPAGEAFASYTAARGLKHSQRYSYAK
jgi:ABC-type transporter Mla maintaining outer membrane lipid asymmetry ATPase subunit MlaF